MERPEPCHSTKARPKKEFKQSSVINCATSDDGRGRMEIKFYPGWIEISYEVA